MTEGEFFTLILTLLAHTSALVWWGASLTTTVKRNSRDLIDHEFRLREVEAIRLRQVNAAARPRKLEGQ